MVGAFEHVLRRSRVFGCLVAVAPILFGDLPSAKRITLTILEPLELFLGADLQPELDDDHAFERIHPFELNDLLVGATPLIRGGEALDALDEHTPVPTAIEHRHATEARYVWVEAPEERVTLLVERRLGERRDAVMARIERIHETLDGTTLSGGVAALEHEQHPGAEVAGSRLTADVQTQSQPTALKFGETSLVVLA